MKIILRLRNNLFGKTVANPWQNNGNYFCTTMNHNEPFEPLFLFRLLESQIDS